MNANGKRRSFGSAQYARGFSSRSAYFSCDNSLLRSDSKLDTNLYSMTAEVLFSFMFFSSIPRLVEAHGRWRCKRDDRAVATSHFVGRRVTLLAPLVETLLLPEARCHRHAAR
ncbi:MAG: hypothetical protein R3C10_03575 [Pirellulales bacterium]